MVLSTKGRYGLRAIYELSLYYGKEPMKLKQIADACELSETYLEQLFNKLKKGGVIKSIRGAHGGYVLAESPEETSVGAVLRILEGDIITSECVQNNVCENENKCVTRFVWERIENSISDVIDNITLADIKNNSSKAEELIDGKKNLSR